MHCVERDRLLDIHLAVVAQNTKSAPAIAKLKSEGWSQTWWDAVMEARKRCLETLAALNRHRSQHGC